MAEPRLATLSGTGAVRRVELRVELDAPIRTVWDAITRVEHLAHWWRDWRPGGLVEPREGGQEIAARLSRGFNAPIGTAIRLSVDLEMMHVFDAESGKAVL